MAIEREVGHLQTNICLVETCYLLVCNRWCWHLPQSWLGAEDGTVCHVSCVHLSHAFSIRRLLVSRGKISHFLTVGLQYWKPFHYIRNLEWPIVASECVTTHTVAVVKLNRLWTIQQHLAHLSVWPCGRFTTGLFLLLLTTIQYGGDAGNTVEENSSIFCLI